MDQKITNPTFDLIFSLGYLLERTKRLEGEVQALQADLGYMTNTLNQAVSVYVSSIKTS